MNANLSEIRNDYTLRVLTAENLPSLPLDLLKEWVDEAISASVNEPTAMSLATADANGQPSCRIVLLKEITNKGITFFTNYQSNKGQQLEHNPKAAVVLFWPELERQVRIEGVVKKTSSRISDIYFNSRPVESRISAIVSSQSAVIDDRETLTMDFEIKMKEAQNKTVQRPEHWGGYQITPHMIEFWQGRPHRLHDRFQYLLTNKKWIIQRLAP